MWFVLDCIRIGKIEKLIKISSRSGLQLWPLSSLRCSKLSQQCIIPWLIRLIFIEFVFSHKINHFQRIPHTIFSSNFKWHISAKLLFICMDKCALLVYNVPLKLNLMHHILHCYVDELNSHHAFNVLGYLSCWRDPRISICRSLPVTLALLLLQKSPTYMWRWGRRGGRNGRFMLCVAWPFFHFI